MIKYTAKYRATEIGKIKVRQWDKNYRTTSNGKLSLLWKGAKRRAKVANLPFTISKEFLKQRLKNTKGLCEQTGIAFSFSQMKNLSRNPLGPSLDQKIPGLGYTEENIQIVCWWYNAAKGELTDSQIWTLIIQAKERKP